MDRGSRRQGIALLVVTLGSMALIVFGSLTGIGVPAPPDATPTAPPPFTAPATPTAAP